MSDTPRRNPTAASLAVTFSTILALLSGCAGNGVTQTSSGDPSPSPSAQSSPGKGDGTVTLVVHGMGCPLCANNVDKQLLKISGVRKVDVNLGNGSVKVQYAGAAPTKAQLVKAVADSGYTLVKVEGI
jgi:copper chaperone CopZ